MEKKINFTFWLTALFLSSAPVVAEELDTNTAQMQAMDKITGRVSIIEVPVGGEVKFGSFSVVVRSCKTRSEEEIPENFAFVDVTDKSFDQEEFNIFKGWMFSSSPAVNAVEHPIYDVWLLKCLNGEAKPEQTLSAEVLAKRDALPRLADIRQQQQNLKENTLEEPQSNIQFKDSMYKEEPPAEEKNTMIPIKADGEPENLLNITESYEEPQNEAITIPAEELSKAIDSEVKNLELKNSQTAPAAPLEEVMTLENTQSVALPQNTHVQSEAETPKNLHDDLTAAIEEELAKQ